VPTDLAQDGFNAFVAARYPALVRWATVLTGDHHEAEDLLQGALVKAVAVWARIAENPEPYVRRIVVNDNISRWRRHRGRTVPTADPWSRGEVQAARGDDPDTRLDVETALAMLAPRQRTVLVLRYLEDLTERETAALMGVSVGTVKSHSRDALARLRSLVPDLVWHDGPHAQRDQGVPHR